MPAEPGPPGGDELAFDPHDVHGGQAALGGGRTWGRGALGLPHRLGGQFGLVGGVEQRDAGKALAEAGGGFAEHLTPARDRHLQVTVEVVDAAVDGRERRTHGHNVLSSSEMVAVAPQLSGGATKRRFEIRTSRGSRFSLVQPAMPDFGHFLDTEAV